jgi:hypothetical protein
METTMDPPIDPSLRNLPQSSAERERAEELGAIVAVVAIAALIIAAMLYILAPQMAPRGPSTTEAPAVNASTPPGR